MTKQDRELCKKIQKLTGDSIAGIFQSVLDSIEVEEFVHIEIDLGSYVTAGLEYLLERLEEEHDPQRL